MQKYLAKGVDREALTTGTNNSIYCIGQFPPIASGLLEHCVEKDSEVSTELFSVSAGLIAKWAMINLPCLSQSTIYLMT